MLDWGSWAVWALLATWLIVLPYVVLFPPPLTRLRRGVQARRDAALARSARVRPEWVKHGCEGAPAATVAATTVAIPRGKCVALVFVNRMSGGQNGGALVDGFRQLLSDVQVVDVSATDPRETLAAFAASPTTAVRVLVAGGDGTVSWIMSVANELRCEFPIAVLPLGTGNDLARSLSWGSGFAAGGATVAKLRAHLARTIRATHFMLDRWRITITDRDGERQATMINYFSFGIDAEISLKFHQERQLHPERFTSQHHNVLKYAFYGFEGAFEGHPLGGDATIERLDGTPIDVNPLWKGVIVSNVPRYHGGKNFWGEGTGDSFSPCSMSDRRLEVMAVAGTFHIGLINIAVDTALRLDQPAGGVRVRVPDRCEMCFQVDGEPWRQQGPATLTVEHGGQYPVLVPPAAGGKCCVWEAPSAENDDDEEEEEEKESEGGGGARGGGGLTALSSAAEGSGESPRGARRRRR